MKLIQEFKIDRFVKENFNQAFQIEDSGLYALEIVATAKSWWQNLIGLRSFFKDDDLAVKIDDREFPKLNGRRGLFDSEAAWNGNNLAGLKKTNVFLIKLNSGAHSLHFLADQKPYLIGIKISQIQTAEKISYLPPDNPPEDGNRRPWLTIILANLALDYLSIQARADERKNDDDDLKLIIDGQIQKNSEPKAHRYWYWCGRILKGESKTFSQILNLPPKRHYLELWADRMPVVESIRFSFGESPRLPTVDDPRWTGDFADDSEDILLARLIFGESENQPKDAKIGVGFSVINRVKRQRHNWGLTLREVILKVGQYDAFRHPERKNKVTNPLQNQSAATAAAWRESYEIAKGILSGSFQDPTNGATNFHSFKRTENFPKWATARNFKIKLGDIYFYELES